MGYYTYYSVEVLDYKGEPADRNTLVKMGKDLNKITDGYFCNVDNYGDYGIDDILGWESIKWYDYENDMLALSRLYPTYRFNLYGYGEERDDNWIEHFKNGRCVHRDGYIQYEPWDPKVLEEEED